MKTFMISRKQILSDSLTNKEFPLFMSGYILKTEFNTFWEFGIKCYESFQSKHSKTKVNYQFIITVISLHCKKFFKLKTSLFTRRLPFTNLTVMLSAITAPRKPLVRVVCCLVTSRSIVCWTFVTFTLNISTCPSSFTTV